MPYALCIARIKGSLMIRVCTYSICDRLGQERLNDNVEASADLQDVRLKCTWYGTELRAIQTSASCDHRFTYHEYNYWKLQIPPEDR